MALFTVNRYGDEPLAADESCEVENLSKLQEKIERRRQWRLRRLAKLDQEKAVTAEKASEELNHQSDNESQQVPQIIDNDEKIIPTEPTVVDASQFKILGVKQFEKKTKVKRILPYWLRNPAPISLDLKEASCKVKRVPYLNDTLKKKLLCEKIITLFPVQATVIPWLLQQHRMADYFWPKDLCVSAPTGSGKTLAYVLPIVQLLTDRMDRQIRALIVLPVKELASQVAKVFKDYCIGTSLKVALITGSVSYQQEVAQLLRFSNASGFQSRVDIVVCTAGRLVEHLQKTEGFSLKHLQFLVIDEADRIMQHIQNDWLHHLNRHQDFNQSLNIGKALPLNVHTLMTSRRPPQKLFFSATLSQDPEKLEEWGLFQPKLFSVSSSKKHIENEPAVDGIGKYTTPLELTEKYVVGEIENKPAILYILLEHDFERTLVFTNSAQSAHRLTVLLKNMLKEKKVAEISSALNQKVRTSILKKFQMGDINILISTDALARGIDVADCDCVISYDPPKNIKTYVHRVGRTGRAGKSGTAISLLIHNQLKQFQEIMKTAEKSDIERIYIEDVRLESVQELCSIATESFKERITQESANKVKRLKSLKRGRVVKRKKNVKKIII